MRSDDCTVAWADWLNDFFFISSRGSTCCTALPLPVAFTLPPITSPTPNPFSSVSVYTPFPILYVPPLWELLCLVMCLQQWLPPNLQDSHFHKRSRCHNHSEEHRQDRFCLFARWFQGILSFESVLFKPINRCCSQHFKVKHLYQDQEMLEEWW